MLFVLKPIIGLVHSTCRLAVSGVLDYNARQERVACSFQICVSQPRLAAILNATISSQLPELYNNGDGPGLHCSA